MQGPLRRALAHNRRQTGIVVNALYIRSRNASELPAGPYRTADLSLDVVYVGDLPDAPVPLRHHLIIVPMQSDEIMLSCKSAWLEGAWRQGASILANDIVALPYISFLKPFEPIPLPGLGDYAVQRHTPHPAFDGLPHDFHLLQGMAGVYGVGHNPPPPGATVINTIGRGAYAIDWYLENEAGGIFFCHGGPDISAFHSDPDATPNLTHDLIDWLVETRS